MLLSNMFNTFDRLTDQYGVYKVGSPLPGARALAGHMVCQPIMISQVAAADPQLTWCCWLAANMHDHSKLAAHLWRTSANCSHLYWHLSDAG